MYNYVLNVIVLLVLINQIISVNILREIATHNQRIHYTKGSEASKDHIHEVIISIKQNNLDILEKLLYEISTPESTNYGKYLTFDEIGNLVSNRNGTNIVLEWLKSNGITVKYQSYYGEYIVASSKVSNWENLLDTRFHRYHPSDRIKSKDTFFKPLNSVVRALSYSLPEEVNPHIHSIFRLINLPPIRAYTSKIRELDLSDINNIRKSNKIPIESIHLNGLTDTYVTPTNLKSIYEITGDGGGLGSQTVYGSLGQTFLPSDLQYFQDYFDINDNPVTSYIGPIPDSNACLHSSTNNNCVEASLDVQYLTSIGNNVPTTYFYDPGDDNDFVGFMVNVSSLSNPTLVYSISYGSYEVGLTSNEISAFNYEAMKLGARGVTIVAASGDDGIAGFLFRDGTISTSKCGYYATWPASCPYVTSIGGTMGGMETTGSRSQEIVCSVSSGSGITSGGGFSNSIPAPDFQISAINNYINKYKPKQSNYQRYNTKNRGFPDLAMPANLYIVSIGQKFYGIDGTSASAPVFAGLVSLVNAIKLRQGQSPLGWLNPTIYRNNGEFTNDITSGNNDCTASAQHCCSFGFQATSGWDPITGFGSVNYNRFLNYYISLVNTYNPTAYPTISPTNKPTSLPTNRPTPYPTWKSTPMKRDHYVVSFDIIQGFNSYITSQQLSSDILAQSAFVIVISNVFESLTPSYVNYVNSYEKEGRLTIDYIIAFDIYDNENVKNITSLLYSNITNRFNYSITNDIFNYQLISSSNSLINQLVSVNIPMISSPRVSYSFDTTKSTNNQSITYSIIILITVVVIIIIGLLLTYLLRYKKSLCHKKDFNLISLQSNHDIELTTKPAVSTSNGWDLNGLLAKSYNPVNNNIKL